MNLHPFWYAVAGIVVILVLYENAPKWAGWLIVILLLGFMAYSARKVGFA